MESASQQNPAEFDAKLIALTPRLLVLPAMAGLCVLVWLAGVLTGGMNWLHPNAQVLLSWGANSNEAVQTGQWWRLLTSMFLHAGIVHLAVNLLALWQAGVLVTRLLGNRGFAVVYIGSGLVGSALSLHFAAGSGVAVGASGAVFGVTGALLASVVQHWRDIPIARSKPLLLGLGFFVIYSFVTGLMGSGSDNAAHAGGLIAGIACGFLLVEKIDTATSEKVRQLRMGLAAALCAVAMVVGVVTAAPAAGNASTTLIATPDASSWPEVRLQLARVVMTAQQDAQLNQAGKLQTSSFLEHLKNTHVPALRKLEAKLTNLAAASNQVDVPVIAAHLQFAIALRNLFEAQIAQAALPSAQGTEEIKHLSESVSQARQLIGMVQSKK